MDGSRNRCFWLAAVCLPAIMTCPEAKAQGTPVAGYPATTSPGMGTGMNMGMGMGFMPVPYGMFGSATPSATDAAALGMPRPVTPGMGMGVGMGMGMGTGTGMGGQSNNVFANPMAAPMFYGSMYSMTPQQQGLMMLAGQTQMMGIGSGQLSGVRPGPGGPSRGRTAPLANAKRGSASVPGGLAARYFHRTAPVTRYPQSYYVRQNRYFPQVTR